MNYLIDTNIIVTYARSVNLANKIESKLNLFSPSNNLGISVVSLGELNSLTHQFNYGLKRQVKIQNLLNLVLKMDINIKAIIDKYGEIDAFSQGKLKEKPLNMTARNMGKNDLWIAATASAYDLTLVTMDKDFQHLTPAFLKLKYVDIRDFK